MHLSPTATAVLAIDLQNEYRPGALWAVEGYDTVLANAAALMAAARAAGLSVFHAQASVAPAERDAYALQEATISEDMRSAVEGSEGAAICAEVAPHPGDELVIKHWPSAFRETDLEARLRARGIDTLVVAGVLTDSCVTGTVFDAVYAGFRVWLVKEACGSMTGHMHRTGMLDMANRLYGGGVLRQAAAVAAIGGAELQGWRCTRPVEFAFTAATVDALYDSL
ncbi:isochorismatase family cysteine hydrolase [Frigidibacter sp. MR17.14]|uniref:cysteine hydrolase family protein n=1 Tax=Frigidibacter sp. MR17.14 TaxID=3126509 RepID=UPI003012DD93